MEQIKRILLRESTFNLWNDRKDSLGIKCLTNIQFVEILQHQSVDELRAWCQSHETNDEC